MPAGARRRPAVAGRTRPGLAFLQAGDFAGGRARVRDGAEDTCPRSYPAESGARIRRALARRTRRRRSRTSIARSSANAGDYAPALAGRATALLALGRTRAALAAFEAALAADPSLTELRSRVDVLRFAALEQDWRRRAAAATPADSTKRAGV